MDKIKQKTLNLLKKLGIKINNNLKDNQINFLLKEIYRLKKDKGRIILKWDSCNDNMVFYRKLVNKRSLQ